MKKTFVLPLLLILAGCFFVRSQQSTQPKSLVFTHVTVIDATGTSLIPGLWDMHVHWYGYDKGYLRLFTANGVTGVRIMWGAPIHFEWRREIQDGTLLGPRMVIASTIVDGPNPIWPASIAVANATEARQAVIKLKQAGYDFIKVYSVLPREA